MVTGMAQNRLPQSGFNSLMQMIVCVNAAGLLQKNS